MLYTSGMDNLLDIPKDRKQLNVALLCALIGMTMLSFLLALSQDEHGSVALQQGAVQGG